MLDTQFETHSPLHLTEKRPTASQDVVDRLELRPGLFAHYRDLTKLRYDFPLVLVRSDTGPAEVQTLSGLVDGVLNEIAQGADGDRVRKQVLRLEQEIRTLAPTAATGSLLTLWAAAAERLGAPADELLRDSLGRARAALKSDGEVIDCTAEMPARLLRYAWNHAQEEKACRVRDDLNRLSEKLADILRADFVRSEVGRSARSLKASFGSLHADVFDFAAMARLLATAAPLTGLPETRRQRIRRLLSVLESQRFFAEPGARGQGAQTYSFLFESCTAALAAYRERLPKVTEFAKAIAIAELEVAGEYRESIHDSFFEEFGVQGLDPNDLALFPQYLVCVNAADLEPLENAALQEILSAGLPMKVLVQTDDILEESHLGKGRLGFGSRSRQLAHLALGLNEVYVLQASGSHLFQFRDQIHRGLAFRGPALFSVFSGATPNAADLPVYLVAAAAMESRAFPAFVYDPALGPDWASRFHLEANPQADQDWPVQKFAYEDEGHQRISQDLAFTVVDFVACDRRYARHFARIPRAKWNANLVPVGDCLGRDTTGLPGKVPYLLLVDRNNVLQKVQVDDQLMREARRCRELWHSLQELGGIHNSHAERLLARERKAQSERERGAAEARDHGPKPVATPSATTSLAPPAAAAEAQPEKSSDEPYIETPRCTSCNECTNINDKMFAYNENKQAFIADLDAGTYAQLVEAAESCQVAIIHPGKPRNPNEPGLEELVRRADAFR